MNNGTNNESYAFDNVGNRTSSHLSNTYNYQPFNRVSSTQTANYLYDTNGNMIIKSDGTNLWHYYWDYENRLVRAFTRKKSVRYAYDALGRRVQRYFIEDGNTKFIYDGQDVVADDNAGVLTKYQNGLGIDNKLKMVSNGQAKYFLADHLGSTTALTDSSGNVSSSASYDSFGNATGNLTTRYQYTGREYDSFTGLHYYRARFYDGKLGRFISEDPIGFAGGSMNLYGYVGNNPLNFVDPFGLMQDGPINYLRDPVDHDSVYNLGGVTNGLSNTLSDLLSLDDVAEWSWTLGNHCLPTKDRIWAGAKLGGTVALNIGGEAVVGRYLTKAAGWFRRGRELTIGKNFRAAPFGNRTTPPHPIGKYPHYHRQGPKYLKGNKKGQPLPGQGKGRHRPWESSPFDKSFWDRF